MTKCIQEGNLVFEFPTPDVLKYDQSNFYRKHFINECSKDNAAVDFLYCRNKISWLVEVKDYRYYPRENPSDLAEDVARKVRDTLAGVAAARLAVTDTATQAMAERFLKGNHYRVVLHLEQTKHPSKLNPMLYKPADLLDKLKRLVRAVDVHPKVVDMTNCGKHCPWLVRRATNPDYAEY